uniref:IS630 family transposase n=1 Tax=Halobellus sp. EA9 TaxID=3421647 RepID=UPI003EB9A5E7
HLSEDDLDRLLAQTDDKKVSKRIIFIKRLYKGATLEDAADDVGMSQSTGSRWAKLWNKGGLGLLAPSFGGQPASEARRETTRASPGPARRGRTLEETGDSASHQRRVRCRVPPELSATTSRYLGLSYAIPRTERPDRPENADEILDERVADAFAEDDGDKPHNKQPEDDSDEEWTLDDDVRTDGGTTVGFFDVSHPQPWDNSQRLYTVSEPTITRPLVKIDTPAAGFYALNGESVLQFPPNQEKEEICACLEEIREQNPGERILLVLDNFSSLTYLCAHAQASI